jgi:MFS family permease
VSGVQSVVDAYTLVFAALILSAGALGDRSSHKRMLEAGFAVFTLASAACGLVPTIGELIAARAVQGPGAAALGASSLALINHTYPDKAGRARAVSVRTAGGAAPLATGLAFLPVTVLIVLSNLVAGRILPARGSRPVVRAGALLMGVGCLTMLGRRSRAQPRRPMTLRRRPASEPPPLHMANGGSTNNPD